MASHLVVSALNFSPFFSIVPNSEGNATISGFCTDIFSWLSALLKIQITYAVVDPIEVELYGTTKAGINQLLNNESDILLLAMTPTLERIKLIDFTQPVTNGDLRLMLPHPNKERVRVTAFLEIISPQVWMVTVAIYFAAIAFISTYQYRYLPSDESKSSFLYIINFVGRRILYSVTIFSGRSGFGNHSIIPYNTRFPVRLVIAVWALMVSIILFVYSTFLTSHLTVPKFTSVVNSFHELAASHEYKLVEPLDTDLAQFFLDAKSEPYKSLGESLRNQKPSLTLTNFSVELYDGLLKHNGAYAQDSKEIQFRIGTDMKRNGGKCRFTASRVLEIHKPFPMALRKGDPNLNNIDKGLMRLRESGLMDHWISSYMNNINKCLIKESISFRDEIRSFTAMNLSHQVGSFIAVAILISLSILSFVCELILFKKGAEKQTNKERLPIDELLPSFKLATLLVLK